jgi:hypothetical protein
MRDAGKQLLLLVSCRVELDDGVEFIPSRCAALEAIVVLLAEVVGGVGVAVGVSEAVNLRVVVLTSAEPAQLSVLDGVLAGELRHDRTAEHEDSDEANDDAEEEVTHDVSSFACD